MNIFEDLIEELKEENLLERTVIEINNENKLENSATENEVKEDVSQRNVNDFDEQTDEALRLAAPLEDSSLPENSNVPEEMSEILQPSKEETKSAQTDIWTAKENGAEFYQKRATEEVKGLQMVEHVFSAVEREQMKVASKPYDDLECKKALHKFLQISQDPNSSEHAKAEFQLMQETESWYSALSRRDRNISVTHLRRYCETTRPALSYEALIALARFYRNSPFSEAVRTKFDLIMVRVFSRELKNEKRQLPFTREELIKHLDMLYSQWASISLYSAAEDNSEILLITLKFEEFMMEADAAESFDELIKKDFFNRLRNFKETTNENFYAPLVTATAIECNIRIGNRYIDLIQAEREKENVEALREKYGFDHDHLISESSSKTLQLIKLLNKKFEKEESEIVEVQEKTVTKLKAKPLQIEKSKEKKSLFKVNKWLLAATILIVLVNIGLYIWMSQQESPQLSQQSVERVNLENSTLRDFIKEGRITNSTFFGVVEPNWINLDDPKKEEVLKKIYSISDSKGFTKVHLLDSNGKTVGYIDGVEMKVN
ncbi:hypothetical protein BH10ACI1_BH10ACI1_09930 [soil metagenome]